MSICINFFTDKNQYNLNITTTDNILLKEREPLNSGGESQKKTKKKGNYVFILFILCKFSSYNL